MFRILYLPVIIILSAYFSGYSHAQKTSDNLSATPSLDTRDFGELKKYINDTIKEANSGLIPIILPQIAEIVKRETEAETANIKKQLDNITAEQNIQKHKAELNKDNAKKAFDKAQRLADDGKIKEAGFYYAVACSKDPEEGLYLFGYVKAVLNWADRLAKRGSFDAALATLYDMEAFLYSGVTVIDAGNADSVAGLIKNVTDAIKRLKTEAGAKITDTEISNTDTAVKKALETMSLPIPENEKELEDYKTRLENDAENIIRLSKGQLTPILKETMKKISEKIKNVSDIIDAEKYLKRADRLLLEASYQQNPVYASQFLSEAAAISQRLSASFGDMSPDLKRRILKFGDNLTKTSAEVMKKASAMEFDKLKAKYDALIKRLSTGETNATKALSLLTDFQDELAIDSSKITDSDYLKRTRNLFTSLNGEIEKWREIQVKRYESWGIKTVRKFYDTYKNEMGVLGSGSDTKDKIYAGMKDYLCPIEVRYLGSAGFKAYSEVFDFFYKELDRDRRLELSSEFVNCEKRPLSFF